MRGSMLLMGASIGSVIWSTICLTGKKGLFSLGGGNQDINTLASIAT